MSTLLTSSPVNIRKELLDIVLKDLRGPAEGPEEIIKEQTVSDRYVHAEMDRAVASIYGWNDLELGHGFHETAQGVRFTVSESARRESRRSKVGEGTEVEGGVHVRGSDGVVIKGTHER